MAEFVELFRQCWHLVYWSENTLLAVWRGSRQILVFFGVSLMTSWQHHEVGSSTFFMIPAAAYLSRDSFSLMCLATGTRSFVLVRRQLLLRSELAGPRQPRPLKFPGYCFSMSSFVSFPEGPGVFWRDHYGFGGWGRWWVTACPCWVGQDGSFVLTWYCRFELLVCLGPDWSVTSGLGRRGLSFP